MDLVEKASESRDGTPSSTPPPTVEFTVPHPSSLSRSTSLPPPTTSNCLDVEISEGQQHAYGNNENATMEKASLTVTTTQQLDSIPLSAQIQMDTATEVNQKSLASSTTAIADTITFVPSLGSVEVSLKKP